MLAKIVETITDYFSENQVKALLCQLNKTLPLEISLQYVEVLHDCTGLIKITIKLKTENNNGQLKIS